MVDRIVDHIVERIGVLLLGFDQLRPEAPAEDVVLAAMALVEGTGVGAVQVTHAVREVRHQCLDDQVVVVAHQAPDVDTPLIAVADAVQDVEEDDPVGVVEDDRVTVVAARCEVVVRPRCEVASCAAHGSDGSHPWGRSTAVRGVLAQVRRGPGTCQAPDWAPGAIARPDLSGADVSVGTVGLVLAAGLRGDLYAATLDRSRCW